MDTVTNFVAHVRKHGIAKKNKFRVSIPFPQKLVNSIATSGGGAVLNQFDPSGTLRAATDLTGITDGRGPLSLSRQLSLVCLGTRMPGTNIITVDAPWLGHHEKVGISSNSEDIEFLFMVSADGAEQMVLEKWTNMICDHKTGKVGYYDDYVTERIRIGQVDDFNLEQHYMEVVEAYPITVNSLDLDRTSSNEFNVISVTFSFKRIAFKGSVSLLDQLEQTKAVQIVDDVLKGDFVSAAQNTAQVALDVASGDYLGEALGAYDMIKGVSDQLAVNPKHTRKLLNSMKNDISTNSRISAADQSSLSTLIDDITG